MSDVFDDIAKAYTAGLHDGRKEAASEIERLREALRLMLSAHDNEWHPMKVLGCEIVVARAALGEDK